ncbi:MAG TPA: Rid family detoxifying hydrolase [Acidimicrobiia bacterium]|nr:Rid family detoxifying hydrolase [Acidimicrobiia bacterium]
MARNVLATPSAPAPMAPYSVAVEAQGLVFLSGQVAFDPATGQRETGDIQAQTRRVMDNIGAILGDLGLGYDDIVKTTIFLADIATFPRVNEIYGQYFKGDPPARSTFQVGALPGGFLIEIEVIASR